MGLTCNLESLKSYPDLRQRTRQKTVVGWVVEAGAKWIGTGTLIHRRGGKHITD